MPQDETPTQSSLADLESNDISILQPHCERGASSDAHRGKSRDTTPQSRPERQHRAPELHGERVQHPSRFHLVLHYWNWHHVSPPGSRSTTNKLPTWKSKKPLTVITKVEIDCTRRRSPQIIGATRLKKPYLHKTGTCTPRCLGQERERLEESTHRKEFEEIEHISTPEDHPVPPGRERRHTRVRIVESHTGKSWQETEDGPGRDRRPRSPVVL